MISVRLSPLAFSTERLKQGNMNCLVRCQFNVTELGFVAIILSYLMTPRRHETEKSPVNKGLKPPKPRESQNPEICQRETRLL